MSRTHWIDSESLFDRVVVLTEDAVHTSNPDEKRLDAIRDALEAGQPVANAIKDDVTSILITAITQVKYDRNEDDVEISYRAGKESKTETIHFSTSAMRDDFAGQLAERLEGFTSKTKAYSPLRAAVGPFTFGTFVTFLTWVFHGLAVEMAAGDEVSTSGRRAGLKKLVVGAIDLIGPIGVLIVGGLILALTVATLVMRVKTPPIMVTMKRAR